jgi:hypothetical protein
VSDTPRTCKAAYGNPEVVDANVCREIELENAELRRELDEAYENCIKVCEAESFKLYQQEYNRSPKGSVVLSAEANVAKYCACAIRQLKSTATKREG